MVLKKTRLGGFFVARAKVKWRRAAQFTLAQGRATLARAFMWGTIARSGAHFAGNLSHRGRRPLSTGLLGLKSFLL